jgi:hypothetical protein
VREPLDITLQFTDHDREYQIDVGRDFAHNGGMGVHLTAVQEKKRVAAIHWPYATGEFTIVVHEPFLPLSVIEQLITAARTQFTIEYGKLAEAHRVLEWQHLSLKTKYEKLQR